MATNIAIKRIKREFEEAIRSDEFAKCSIKLELLKDCWTELRGEIAGPSGTPYEGGKYLLDISVPENYPFSPPKVKFITKIWHPNISSVTGAVCLDILKDKWAAAMTLRTVLLSLQALLSSAEPDDPQDAVVAKQYKQNPHLFKLTAEQWAHMYAGASSGSPHLGDMIQKLIDIGVDQTQAVVALSSSDWDIQRATDYLFS